MLGIFLDTETNGLNPHKHKLIEIAFKIIDVETGGLEQAFEAVVFQPKEIWAKSDPASIEITGFTYEQIAEGQKHEIVKAHIIESFQNHGIKKGNAVFICQNPSFDRAFFSQLIDADEQEALQWPYHWLDLASMYWALSVKKGITDHSLYPWITGFSKDKIAKIHNLPSEEKPHRAMNGVNHLLLCYRAVVGFDDQ
jgi:oligoribonuclease